MNLIVRKLNTAWRLLKYDHATLFYKFGISRFLIASVAARASAAAQKYLTVHGINEFLVSGLDTEFSMHPAKSVDLRNLHQRVRVLKPKNIIEFGCGFSSIVLAHALSMNAKEGASGKLFVIEASEQWASNVSKKLEPFGDIAEVRFVTPELINIGAQLCHVSKELPDIRPDFIYLDGPDPRDVQGEFRGLSFGKGGEFACSADLLLYEWFLYPGFVMVVDGRNTNVDFLRGNLKRRWKIRRNWILNYSVFELLC